MSWRDWIAIVLTFLVIVVLSGPVRRISQRHANRLFGRNGPPSRWVAAGGLIGGALECIVKRWAERRRKAMALGHFGSLQVTRNWMRRYHLGRRDPDGRRWQVNRTLLLAVLADRRARSK
jgi:hypothetical protein